MIIRQPSGGQHSPCNSLPLFLFTYRCKRQRLAWTIALSWLVLVAVGIDWNLETCSGDVVAAAAGVQCAALPAGSLCTGCELLEFDVGALKASAAAEEEPALASIPEQQQMGAGGPHPSAWVS